MDTTIGSATVPLAADLVDWVRRASYIEIAQVAEELDDAVSERGRGQRPHRFQDAAHRLSELCGVLERIGWVQTTPAAAVTVDLDEDDGVLAQVLEGALELAQKEALADEQVRELSELVAF
ncbi:MAG TPA: hypothetical protein VMB51_04160 [Solirubrobacteraceae bacterium]|nr:hypothetical protein [Solirubrobacteraceae bacterium]